MLKSDAIKYYGTAAAVADAIGVRPQAIHQWGRLVPLTRAIQLEELTSGKLKAAPRQYRKAPT